VAALGRRGLGRQRLRHRARRAPHRQAVAKLDKFLLQLGTTGEKGNDGDAPEPAVGDRDSPQRNMIVTDGYGNNRVILFDKNGKFHQAGRQGAGGPTTKAPAASGTCAQARGRRERESLLIDREGHRIEVFDKDLNYLRELRNDWNPWDREHLTQGHRAVRVDADHKDERV